LQACRKTEQTEQPNLPRRRGDKVHPLATDSIGRLVYNGAITEDEVKKD